MQGDIDGAVAAARRAFELDGTSYSRVGVGETLILAGRYAEAEALVRPYSGASASKLDRSMHLPVLADALAYQGKRRESVRVLDDYPEEVDGKRGMRRAMQLDLLLGDGPTAPVLREARALVKEADPHVTKGLAVVLAWLGDLDAAAQAAVQLPPELRKHYEAAVAYRRGELDRALSLDRELAKTAISGELFPALWMLAHAAFDAGKYDEVISAADRLRTTYAHGWRSWALPDAELLAARALERKGEHAKARARVDAVLAVWKDADPDLPMLAKARELRARLGR